MIKEVRIEIGCKDIEKMMDFYTNTLGGKVLSSSKDFNVLEIGGIMFAIWKANKDEAGFGVTLVVDDFDKAKKTLKKTKSIVEEFGDDKMLLFEDPEENTFSLLEND